MQFEYYTYKNKFAVIIAMCSNSQSWMNLELLTPINIV